MTCEIENCDSEAAWTVEGPNGVREVCRDCMEELVGAFDWSLVVESDRL